MPHIPLAPHLPGITGLLEYRQDSAAPIRELTQVILRGPGSLSFAEREMIATVVSQANGCRFCTAAHEAVTNVLLGENETCSLVKEDFESAPVSDKMKALLNIARLTAAFAQNTALTGQIRDAESNESLAGANITVKNTPNRTQTDANGHFTLETNAGFPLTLLITAVGYDPQEQLVTSAVPLDIRLSANANTLDQIVVTASRTEERALRSPVTVEKMDATAAAFCMFNRYVDGLATETPDVDDLSVWSAMGERMGTLGYVPPSKT